MKTFYIKYYLCDKVRYYFVEALSYSEAIDKFCNSAKGLNAYILDVDYCLRVL